MRFRFPLLSLLVLVIATCHAQDDRRIDSLQAVVKSQRGEQRVESMMELSRAFESVSFDDCVAVGEDAIALAHSEGNRTLEAKAQYKLGLRYLNRYQLDLAKDCFLSSARLQDTVQPTDLLIDVYNNLAYAEIFMGDMDDALDTYHRAMKASIALGDERNCADVTNNIAYIYFAQGDSGEALDYFMKARLLFESFGDSLSVAQCNNNIGNIYYKHQKVAEARRLFKEAIPVFERYEDYASLSHACHNMALIYANDYVNFDSATMLFDKSIELASLSGDSVTVIDGLVELANVSALKGDFDDAVSKYDHAEMMARRIGYVNGIVAAITHKGIAYAKTNRYQASAQCLEQSMALEKENGISLYTDIVRQYLIKDYVRLGRYDDFDDLFSDFLDDYNGILHDNNELKEENMSLGRNAKTIFEQSEKLNAETDAAKHQLRSYKLAFFGMTTCFVCLLLCLLFMNFRKRR